jgi:hypothetical protein
MENKHKKKYKIIKYFVDSRSRNKDLYTYSYKFQIKLDEPYRKVKAIELTNININLNDRYLIHKYNKYFTIQFLNLNQEIETVNLQIDEGDYELGNFYEDLSDNKYNSTLYLGNKIISIINDYLNTREFNHIDCNYEIIDINNKFIFNNFNNKKILFPSINGDSLSHILGFKPDIYYDTTSFSFIISDYSVNFNKEKYGLLYINDYKNIYSNKNSIINSFYIIQSNDNNNVLCSLNKNIKYFNPVEEYIDKLNIKLIDYYGNYINLNNKNFSFELIFYCQI